MTGAQATIGSYFQGDLMRRDTFLRSLAAYVAFRGGGEATAAILGGNAISNGEGSALVFVQQPMSLALVVLVVAIRVLPRVWRRMSRDRKGG